MKRAIMATIMLVASATATAFECEKGAQTAAQMAATAHEGGNLVVDKTTAVQSIYYDGQHAIIWLQVRYVDEERRPTQWCVLVNLTKGCTDDWAKSVKENRPGPTAQQVASCFIIPDEEGQRRLLKSVGWAYNPKPHNSSAPGRSH